MLKSLPFAAVLLTIAGTVSDVRAEEMAATADLPPALRALGVDATHLSSADEAQAVRGHGCGTSLVGQLKQFAIAGQAAGTALLMEGIFAEFEFVNSEGVKVTGQFGGLEAWLAVTDGNLWIATQGKALQETFDFAGEYVQQFVQQY